MEIEKYSPKWLLKKINASKTDAHKLMHIIEYRKELVESTEKQFAIHSVSHQRELLEGFVDWFNTNDKTQAILSERIEEYLKTL
jgi:hypothetical protein